MTNDTNAHGFKLRRSIARWLPSGTPTGDLLRRGAVAALSIGRVMSVPLHIARDGIPMARTWFASQNTIGSRASGRQVVMLVVSSLRIDPRVRQSAETLAANGFDVTIIWPDAEPGQDLPDWGERVGFEPLPAGAANFAWRYPRFLGRYLLAAALKHRPFAFHAHDLNTMLPALIAGRASGAHVICDHHEWFSESAKYSTLRGRYMRLAHPQRVAFRWLERLACKAASAQITVCRSIADEMEHRYPARRGNVNVIRNIPAASGRTPDPYPSLRTALGVRADQTLLLYQGGVGPTRALEPVIEALGLAKDCVLAIRGPAIEQFAASYRSIAARAGAQARLHLLPPIPSRDVVAACNGADAGLYTVADVCKSFTYALPNKVFEYLQAGLPVLTAGYPEVRSLIVDAGVGLGFDPLDPRSIAAAMNRIADPAVRAGMRSQLPALAAGLDPELEWGKLVALYRGLERSQSDAATAG